MIKRSEVRKELARLLEAGVPAADWLIDYQASNFEGRSPVVMVTSAGTVRPQFTMTGLYAKMFFGIHIFVLHADPDSGYTEADAEDTIDQVEFEIASVLAANQSGTYWQGISWEESSIVDKITVSGTSYLYEVLPVVVEVLQ